MESVPPRGSGWAGLLALRSRNAANLTAKNTSNLDASRELNARVSDPSATTEGTDFTPQLPSYLPS
jgi:hypothetical protein